MNSTETPSDAFRWLDPTVNPALEGVVKSFRGRMHLDRTEESTYFIPLVSAAQWESCGRFPESAEEFTEHWTELRGAEEAPLPKSLVNATLEFVEQGLGAQAFSGEVPVFTYTL